MASNVHGVEVLHTEHLIRYLFSSWQTYQTNVEWPLLQLTMHATTLGQKTKFFEGGKRGQKSKTSYETVTKSAFQLSKVSSVITTSCQWAVNRIIRRTKTICMGIGKKIMWSWWARISIEGIMWKHSRGKMASGGYLQSKKSPSLCFNTRNIPRLIIHWHGESEGEGKGQIVLKPPKVVTQSHWFAC